MSPAPASPKIFHIVHADRLPSIIADGRLWSDAEAHRRASPGTVIGMDDIKQRRLTELCLNNSYPDLHVGECVPFYFCPRSVMLYLLTRGNHPELTYRGGPAPIVHLEADLQDVVEWANAEPLRWAFTTSNAGSYFFEDYCDLGQLSEINWDAVQARNWRDRTVKEGKQAEFLLERCFPWQLVERIGVQCSSTYQHVANTLPAAPHHPIVELHRDWYY